MERYTTVVEPLPGVVINLDLSGIEKLHHVVEDYSELTSSEHNRLILEDVGNKLLVAMCASRNNSMVITTSRDTHLAIVHAIIGPDGSSRHDHQLQLYDTALKLISERISGHLGTTKTCVESAPSGNGHHAHVITWGRAV